ncbi:MAG: tetratricopeptide repeat protein [Bacteroidota bacterium]
MSKKDGFKDKKRPVAKVIVQDKKSYYWMPAICIILVLIVFAPVFKAEFVSWDDPDYVTTNQSIKSLSNLHEIITRPVQGNYHPLTMISLAVNYAWSGKDASSYHLVNILLHLLNVLLVFFFVLRLTGKKHWIAFITALLFAIHPLHVESVAWVAERKDVLYAFFFLAGLIAYLHYLEKQTRLKLSAVLGLFILSLLSKPAAIIFPLVLLALDFYYDRLKKPGAYIEKIPFLIFSVIFGLLTIHGQSVQGAVGDASTFPVHFRMFFGFYGIMMYLANTFFPLNLCTFYPFPAINNSLPFSYYLSPAISLVLAALFFFTFRKNKLIAFAILFYLLNLALVLQFLPVGSAIIADRYTYIPLIGVFIAMGYYFQKWADTNSGKPTPAAIGLLVLVTVILTALSYRQSVTWKKSASLWDHAISVSPSSRAYTNRGLIYKLENQNDKAIELYSKAIGMNKAEKDALVNRGNIYFNEHKYDLAIADYNKCLAIDAKEHLAIENRGAAYAATGKFDLALADMNAALKLKPESINGYANRAVVEQTLNQHQAAIDDFYTHMKFTPDETGIIWNSIGVSHLRLSQNTQAIDCFGKALVLSENPSFLINRATALLNTGDKQKARTDIQRAVQLGAKIDPVLLNKLQ